MSIKKTAIYIRVSSDKQAQDGDSIREYSVTTTQKETRRGYLRVCVPYLIVSASASAHRLSRLIAFLISSASASQSASGSFSS